MLFVEIILPVFFIILSGYLLEKCAHLDFRALTTSSLYLFTPALVLSSLLNRELHLDLAGDIFVFMILYTGALLALCTLTGRALKMSKDTRGALSLTSTMMNVGNFGLPLTLFAFGEKGFDVAILTFIVFNIPLGTLAIVIAQGGKAPLGEALKNTLKIPIFHAVVLAFLLKIPGVPLPTFLLRPIDLLGQAAIPIMLVLLGMQIARTKAVPAPGFIALTTIIRLVLAPLLAWWITGLLGMGGISREVVVLQTSTPSAVLPLLYSLRFGTRPDLVAGGILATTLLSAASLTFLLYLLK